MKKISVVMAMGLLACFTHFPAQAQLSANKIPQSKAIQPYHMAIAYSKTTNIVFPYAIVSVDRGSQDVLAQKAKGVENILQIKAAKDSFPQTNLTVLTADGKLTSFLVDYSEQPDMLNVSMTNENQQQVISIPAENINQEETEHYATMASTSKEKARGMKDKSFGIYLKLNGLYIHEDLMFLRFSIRNKTDINYDIDQLRLYIRDQKKVKRTASQEIEITPVFVYNNSDKINGQSKNTFVFVVPKFTISDKKYLAIQMMEKNGGRNLELRIKNKKVVKASRIEE
ncbi:MAG: conjugative transposon protein TraN [Bacteroidetes bacterium 46-16]|nr:MAG: conjugative transposon protein TraN [Bacteroidetes bacterium 46-16]